MEGKRRTAKGDLTIVPANCSWAPSGMICRDAFRQRDTLAAAIRAASAAALVAGDNVFADAFGKKAGAAANALSGVPTECTARR